MSTNIKSIKEGTLRFLGYIFMVGIVGVILAIAGIFIGMNIPIMAVTGLIGAAFLVCGIFMINKANAIKASRNRT
ncbi:MAG: hypothetical protein ACREAY_00505 [Nitrososphaera sp.]|uniref:hypothetical protein n=1 Tax=Nitrososphaera sp. TaxID=1971748 RepID=UPI003D6E7335